MTDRADLGQGPLRNVGPEGRAGIVEEEAYAERREAVVRALVHVSPMVQEEADHVNVTVCLEEGKARLTGTAEGTGRGEEAPCEAHVLAGCGELPRSLVKGQAQA